MNTNNCCCKNTCRCIAVCCCENRTKHCTCAICDVVESVALIEAALAHILNAEGEKIQKAVGVASNIGELLEVNNSVNKTILNAIELENAMLAKLKAVSELHNKL